MGCGRRGRDGVPILRPASRADGFGGGGDRGLPLARDPSLVIPLRGDVNGDTPSGNWSDYPGLGLDNQAIYITTNQFELTTAGDGKFQYARVRIIAKSQLYGPCASPSYFDFWNLTDPESTNERVFTLRPALTQGTPGVEYLVNNSPFETSTYFTLWSLTNPLSASPTLTAQNVAVTATTAPPNADQLGGTGGTSGCSAPCLIDTGDGRLLDLVHRNGFLWTSHGVAGGTGNAYARVRYVRFNVVGLPVVQEDVSFGADGCWYRVTATYQSPAGSGAGTAVAVTLDTGYFWFFSSNNVELVIKVVDGRVVNSHFWVFAGGLTNVNVVITVTDTATGETRTYVNPQGVAFQPIQDTLAFAGLKAGGGAEASTTAAPAQTAAISAGLERLLGARAGAPASPAAPPTAWPM